MLLVVFVIARLLAALRAPERATSRMKRSGREAREAQGLAGQARMLAKEYIS